MNPRDLRRRVDTPGLTEHSQLITKAINARNHGAKAVILVNGKLGDGEEDLLTRFGSVSGPENAGIVIVQAKNDVAQALVRGGGEVARRGSESNQRILDSGFFAFPGNLRVSLKVNVESTRATVNNVLAYLPGKTDEYIIIGAHYDHLGYGNVDSLAPSQIGQIHPGADDNASGTAGVLELARLLAPMKGPTPARHSLRLVCGRRTRTARFGRVGEGADAAARQGRGHDQYGHDRPDQGRKGLYRRNGNRGDVQEPAG